MILLAIDTSLGTSVAVVGDGISVEKSTPETRSHAEVIGSFILDSLAEAGVAPADVAAVVAGLGPGAFTGLRVGIAAAISFGAGREIPVYALSSHDSAGFDISVCTVVSDVRRKELAATSYADSRVVAGPLLTNEAELSTAVDLVTYPEVRLTQVSAARLAAAAKLRLERGEDLSSLAPIYLRAPDVTPSKGPKRVTA